MGIIGKGFSFLLGTGFGIYIVQNYNVPNIKKVVNELMSEAKHVEETYRKRKKGGD